ncbi:mitochondrial carrier [Viridothelium virens]|uniref:Mitochondrial carrier n=1 Tax=Viridothelium virens TaxID=1048519 RepID=A0A6A6H2U1_VIRVR|nr:mitochondrial carrier [Viridothelium virens]
MERSNTKPITMTTSRDTPNPLRPYYVPPSVGSPIDPSQSNASAYGLPANKRIASTPQNKSFGASARDLLSDIDYGEYLPESSPSTSELVKRLANQAVWKYTSVFLAQPFEVAKIVLQCHLAAEPDATRRPPYGSSRTSSNRSHASRYQSYQEISASEDSSDDEPSYFTSTAPQATSSTTPSHRQTRQTLNRSASATPTPPSSSSHHIHATSSSTPYRLEIRHSDSILDALSQLWQKESAFGLWKATNATFIYQILLRTIESWTRSLLAALLSLPDPGIFVGAAGDGGVGGLDVVDSPNPWASLAVAVAAAGVAGTVLAPLDMIRTRLILTPSSSPTTSQPRHLLPSLRALPSLVLPARLLPPTILHATLPALLSTATPWLLRSSPFAHIDPLLTPTAYNLGVFVASAAELFVKLPLETVLRRGHVAVLREQAREEAGWRRREREREVWSGFRGGNKQQQRQQRGRRRSEEEEGGGDGGVGDVQVEEQLQTVVEVGPYKGVVGTMWYIVREEGSRISLALPSSLPGQVRGKAVGARQQKGQGMAGLWRGWTVGMWGLIGVWGALGLGAGSVKEGEF